MKRAPKELLDALRGIMNYDVHNPLSGSIEDLLEEWAPERTNHTIVGGPADHIEQLIHDRDEWKKRAAEAEAEARRCEAFRWESAGWAAQQSRKLEDLQTRVGVAFALLRGEQVEARHYSDSAWVPYDKENIHSDNLLGLAQEFLSPDKYAEVRLKL